MGKKSRSKGGEGERELARLVGGKRISRIGEEGPDVLDNFGNIYEVKRVAGGFKGLYDYIQQAKKEGADLVALRTDRNEWLFVMTKEMWLPLKETAAKLNHSKEINEFTH